MEAFERLWTVQVTLLAIYGGGGGGGGKWALGPNFGGKLTNFTILAPFDPGLLIKSGI